MKKVLAILLALIMCLSCVGAMAEQAGIYGSNPSVTRGQGYSINVEAITELARKAGMPEKDQEALSAILAVISSASTKTVTTANGSQGELFLKGSTIADYVLAADGDKVTMSTSLLPSYTLTVSKETIVSIVEKLMEAAMNNLEKLQAVLEKDADKLQEVLEKIVKAFEGVNFAALDKNYAAYSLEFVAEFLSSVTLSDVEAVEYTFEEKGVAFNAKQTFEVDVQKAVNAAGNLINKKLQDENVPALLSAFNSLGVKITLPSEVSAETLKVEDGATFQGTVYSIVDANGAAAPVPQLIELKAYKDGTAEEDVDKVTIYVSDVDCLVWLTMPTNRTFASFTAALVDENAANFKYTLTDDDGYYAVDGNADLLDDGTVLVSTSLYCMDPDTPVMVAFDAVTPGGELNLPLYGDDKTVVSVEEMLQETEGGKVSKTGALLMVDLINNGLSGLIQNIVNAIPDEISNLLALTAPQK